MFFTYFNHFIYFFFFNDTATTEIYTLSLHDALPISRSRQTSGDQAWCRQAAKPVGRDRKSTRLNSSHGSISYAVFCLKKKTKNNILWLIDKKNTQTNAYNNYDIII